MKPNRSNYEIWFTDFLDGNLSEIQVEELKVFLKENPDLKEELNGLTMVTLNPSDFTFSGKNMLGKSPESLSEEQFEYLCIASLENDLTPGQKSEMNEIINRDEMKRKSFERIQKLKLKPSQVTFKRKSIVKKLTAGQKILRWSFAGLTAAATIAILISLYLFFTSDLKKEPWQTARNIKTDTLFIENPAPVFMKELEVSHVQRNTEPGSSNAITETRASETVVAITDINNDVPESIQDIHRSEVLIVVNIPIPEDIISAYKPSANNLMPYDPGYLPPLIDERSKAGQFLARFFHEKIMKDTTAVSRPVESYEIAEAGITGSE